MVHRHLPVICLGLTGVLADYLTGTYPHPVDLSSKDSVVAKAWRELSSTFDDSLKGSGDKILAPAANITFSASLFSLHDPVAVNLQYHHAGPETTNSTIGTKMPDGDSIYMIASVSKLITTYAGMVLLEEEDWNRPLSDIIPELQQIATLESGPAYTIPWDKITMSALATQVGGIPTLAVPSGDALVQLQITDPDWLSTMIALGLPPLNTSTLGSCAARAPKNASDGYCSGPEAINGFAGTPPNFLPWTTPAYSDGGFMLIGMAVSNITGKPLPEMYADSVFTPLGMASSYVNPPTDEESLSRSIVSEATLLQFGTETGFTVPSGGLYSTVNDLSKLGTGILNFTQLSPEATRMWMKPRTHTGSLSYSIGRGWEIHRFLHPNTNKITEMYTKLGDSGAYGGVLVLLPEYNAGFTLLNAASDSGTRSNATLVVLDYITNTIIPALEAQAEAEARANYVGSYIWTDGQVNASVTIGLNESNIPGITSGLTLTEWVYNGTDVLTTLVEGKPRLEPSIPKQTPDGSPGEAAFQLSVNPQLPTYTSAIQGDDSPVIGTWTGFYTTNGDFAFTDQQRFAGIGVNLFVFDIDEDGRATAVSPAVQRVTLQRTK